MSYQEIKNRIDTCVWEEWPDYASVPFGYTMRYSPPKEHEGVSWHKTPVFCPFCGKKTEVKDYVWEER